MSDPLPARRAAYGTACGIESAARCIRVSIDAYCHHAKVTPAPGEVAKWISHLATVRKQAESLAQELEAILQESERPIRERRKNPNA